MVTVFLMLSRAVVRSAFGELGSPTGFLFLQVIVLAAHVALLWIRAPATHRDT